MGAVGVEKAASVGAEFLDRLLRSDGALRNGLRGDSLGDGFTHAVLDHNFLRLDEMGGVIRV